LKTLKQSFLKAVATVVDRIQQWLKAYQGKNQELDCNEEIMFYAENLTGLVNLIPCQTSMSLQNRGTAYRTTGNQVYSNLKP